MWPQCQTMQMLRKEACLSLRLITLIKSGSLLWNFWKIGGSPLKYLVNVPQLAKPPTWSFSSSNRQMLTKCVSVGLWEHRVVSIALMILELRFQPLATMSLVCVHLGTFAACHFPCLSALSVHQQSPVRRGPLIQTHSIVHLRYHLSSLAIFEPLETQM